MKLRKLALNAIAMEHSEMKSIKAGYYGGYVCYATYESGLDFSCGTVHGNSCMKQNGDLGTCGFTGIVTQSCGCD